jgi:hypothetical protein
MQMERDEIKELIHEVLEASLELQLRAVRQLRGTEKMPPPVRVRRGLRKESLVDLSVRVLEEAGEPLHVSEISERLARKFGRVTDKDSLFSSLGKKAKQGVILKKHGKGSFGLLKEEA